MAASQPSIVRARRDAPSEARNFTNPYRRAITAIHGPQILVFSLTLIPSSGAHTERHTHMKSIFKPLLVASLLAGLSLATSAQGMGPGGGMQHEGMMQRGGGAEHRMGSMDPARMQAMAERRQAAFKAKLKITADQEGAWTTFTSAMKPAPDAMKRRMEMRAEMNKLTTPERIDKMRGLRAERDAAMDKRADAAKAFYAVLTPYQRGVFDAHAAQRHQRGGRHDGPRG